MSKVGSRYRVYLEDGTEFEVDTDERDWAAMEARDFPRGALLTAVRFNVWNAAKRAGLTRRSWEQFNTIDCVRVEDVSDDAAGAEDDQEGQQSLDPGQTTTNGPGVSTSPSSAASRTKVRLESSTGTRGT